MEGLLLSLSLLHSPAKLQILLFRVQSVRVARVRGNHPKSRVHPAHPFLPITPTPTSPFHRNATVLLVLFWSFRIESLTGFKLALALPGMDARTERLECLG